MSGRLEKKMAGAEERTGPVKRDWTRINRRENISAQGWRIQDQAEESACRDMEKPIEQLLSDIHEGYMKRIVALDTLKEGEKPQFADPVALTLQILMRMGSMMAVVSKSNERLQNALLGFTIFIAILTTVIVALTALTTLLVVPASLPAWPLIVIAAVTAISVVVAAVVVFRTFF